MQPNLEWFLDRENRLQNRQEQRRKLVRVHFLTDMQQNGQNERDKLDCLQFFGNKGQNFPHHKFLEEKHVGIETSVNRNLSNLGKNVEFRVHQFEELALLRCIQLTQGFQAFQKPKVWFVEKTYLKSIFRVNSQ